MLVPRSFNLRYTIESGQPLTFHSTYSKSGGTENLKYVTSSGVIDLSIRARRLSISFEGDYNKRTAENEVSSRLGLKTDLEEIYKSINTDPFMADAISHLYGMRITKNDPWETTLCFVISQFNNIKRIRGIIQNMISHFGYEFDGRRLFPEPESIARAELSAIRACGTGFRDRYLKSVAEEFAFSFDAQSLYKMDYGRAKKRLMELDGVGDKVADCILLFGYNKTEAFPIDLWVKRVMERIYFKGRKRRIGQIHSFASRRWGAEYLGYAQQYIFQYGRTKSIK